MHKIKRLITQENYDWLELQIMGSVWLINLKYLSSHKSHVIMIWVIKMKTINTHICHINFIESQKMNFGLLDKKPLK